MVFRSRWNSCFNQRDETRFTKQSETKQRQNAKTTERSKFLNNNGHEAIKGTNGVNPQPMIYTTNILLHKYAKRKKSEKKKRKKKNQGTSVIEENNSYANTQVTVIYSYICDSVCLCVCVSVLKCVCACVCVCVYLFDRISACFLKQVVRLA